MQEIIKDYCLSDVKKKKTLRIYHKSAAEYYLSKNDNPEFLLEASYHYIKAGESGESAQIVINNADEFISKGFWKKIEEPLNNAITTLSRHRHDPYSIKGVGLAHLRIGNFYSKRGDLDLALSHAQDSSKALMRVQEKDLFQLYTLFGTIYRQKGEFDTSMDYFEKCLRLAEKNDDDHRKAVANGNIGIVLSAKGDTMGAIELYCDSLKFFENCNDTKNVASAYFNLSQDYSNLDDYTKAYNFIKKAIKLYKELGATYDIARAHNTYADIYLDDAANEGNFNPALECLFRSLETYQQIGHVRGEANIYSTVGNHYVKQKDYESAIENYEKSILIYEKLNEKSKLDQSYKSIGLCFIKLKNYPKTLEYLEKLVESSQEVEHKLNLAETYIALNEFDKAVNLLKKVIDDTSEEHFLKCLAYILMSISLFSLDKEEDAIASIKEMIQYHSTNKYSKAEWDFSDISTTVDKLKPLQCTLIKDLISLIQNKTTYPIIRFDNMNIERDEANSYAEIFHPFVGHKKITKNDESLKTIMKTLKQGDIEIDIDKSTIIRIERDTTLMTLGFLYKKEIIDFVELDQNNLKIRLTNKGEKIKLPS